jgi:hypothetical protein
VIVIAKRVGRLANRMLLFAHFIGAAVEHGFTVANPAFGPNHARYFPATARDLLCRFPQRRLPVLPGSRVLAYGAARTADDILHALQRRGLDIGLIRLRRDEHIDLNSEAFLEVVRRHRVVLVHDWFFRNGDNVARHRGVIRAYFTPWERHLAAARRAVERARRGGRLVVGVHIRQGDYRRFKDGRFLYTHEQYRRAMVSVEAAFPGSEITFLVCSDAPVPDGCFGTLDVAFGPGHEVEDLYALAHCDRIIGPPSTYSRWASFWGDVPLFVIAEPDEPVAADAFHVGWSLDWGRDSSAWLATTASTWQGVRAEPADAVSPAEG